MPSGAEPLDEVPLPGGNVGGVVRVGDTVRRPTGPWTPAVHALLAHVASRGLDGVPRVLGTDAAGREILTYLDGVVIELEHVTDGQLRSGAAWLGRYHAAVSDFRPGRLRWRFEDRDLRPGEIVCHHDATAYNMLAGTGEHRDDVVGVIDWDVAGPGVPLDELAMLAWSGVPFYRHVDPVEAARRLRVITNGYASSARWAGPGPLPTPADVADHIPVRMGAATARIAAGQRAGDTGMLNLARIGEPAATIAAVAAYAERLPRLRAAVEAQPR
ncbi:aminoglycoside phosphotransferase [Cellulomonas sp. WB94]|uniref:phosphotransferase n=1 Tax=Cellulomonas sp. WB94 TaxID=2173174 RepID=UPI000D567782|nr:phosphotransferase [Cellulomonas sp. WB94]PVU83600.1 aminoglycoside phosphotransferase [Cellulomonas sp. WB94]